MGLLYTGAGFGGLLGPTAAGYAFDQLGSYFAPISAGIAVNLLSLGLILMLRSPQTVRSVVQART